VLERCQSCWLACEPSISAQRWAQAPMAHENVSTAQKRCHSLAPTLPLEGNAMQPARLDVVSQSETHGTDILMQ
jgi:hypothetical protein